jgi:uncharacterized membrane protein YbhN (UPF0104 family)
MTAPASWLPSEHTIVIVGVIAAATVLLSVAVTQRDAWLTELEAHRHLVRRGVIAAVLLVLAAVAIAHLNELEEIVKRVEQGNRSWLALAIGLEVVSFAGYVVLTRAVYRSNAPRVDWTVATELTFAGVVATRVFSAGGAGGIAFTGWVLHRAGMEPRIAARRLSAFMLLLYSFYMGGLVLAGLLVVTGALPNVPALLGVTALVVGGVVIGAALAILRIPGDIERRAKVMAQHSGTIGRIAARLAPVPQVAGNAARLALEIVRERPSVLLWPAVWWAFDIATLWACFHAFGDAPPVGTLLLCYFLGQLGNLLPLPGGVGGTEGGMVGAFAASGVDAGLALIAVVSYQAISTYLPALPGLAGYVDLRRRMRSWVPAEPATAARA